MPDSKSFLPTTDDMRTTDDVRRLLDDPLSASSMLRSWGLEDARGAHANLVAIARHGVTLDLLARLMDQLDDELPKLSDPPMALNNLERFFGACRSPLAFAALLDRDRTALPILLRIFSTSQHLSDLLVREPEGYDLLRLTSGAPVARESLIADIVSEVSRLGDERRVAAALRRFKHRETLRIAYGDLVGGQRLDIVTRQISHLADAVVNAAVAWSIEHRSERFGRPLRPDGRPARYAVLGLGKLGGIELNYSSDIDLIPFYDQDGMTSGPRSVSNREFFSRVTSDLVRLLGEVTELGHAYRVDLRLRPEGSAGPLVRSLDGMLHYYDTAGRTWERQAFVKARPVAGDDELGRELLERLDGWIWRRYLSRADISGIKALKRRIEQRSAGNLEDRTGGGEVPRDVKSGLGGIRDIEFVLQFLQLLNGGDLTSIRTTQTLEALERLAEAGCVTLQERNLLERNYVFLREVEHRLQILFDQRTHELPSDPAELRKLARRMGYVDGPSGTAETRFLADVRERTETDRKMLDFLLHDAFADDDATHPIADLVLDPEPPAERIAQVLGRLGFADVGVAYRHLTELARERVPFLSTRRCRHFLASIAPRLLEQIARTPDPDGTLVRLASVADSIGGKGVLWELFRFHEPTLELMVRLGASGDYLSGMLIEQPGMIDELLDSLLLERLPSGNELRRSLVELCRGAEDIDPILHAFRHTQHLAIGVRDLLGKVGIDETHRALSDVAESVLEQAFDAERRRLESRHGIPTTGADDRPCECVVLALGKLAGREPNYHSDLDLVFLYEGEGTTRADRPSRQLSNQQFFAQLAASVVKRLSQVGPYGRLYEVDTRLRPTGRSGSIAVSFDEFRRYFDSGAGALWERLALVKSRPVIGSEAARREVERLVAACRTAEPWRPADATEILAMRLKLQESAATSNLKRGRGGTMDVEFAAQMLQLRHAKRYPEAVVPGTFAAWRALADAGLVERPEAEAWSEGYRMLRDVESRLRLMNTAARHELPSDPRESARLAYVLREEDPQRLVARLDACRDANRRRLERLVERLAAEPDSST